MCDVLPLPGAWLCVRCTSPTMRAPGCASAARVRRCGRLAVRPLHESDDAGAWLCIRCTSPTKRAPGCASAARVRRSGRLAVHPLHESDEAGACASPSGRVGTLPLRPVPGGDVRCHPVRGFGRYRNRHTPKWRTEVELVHPVQTPGTRCRHPVADGRHPVADGRHPVADGRHPVADGRHPLADRWNLSHRAATQ